MERCRF